MNRGRGRNDREQAHSREHVYPKPPILKKTGITMDLSSVFSDDQMAIIGCFAAISVCGLVAALSFKLGPASQQQKSKPQTIPMNSARSGESVQAQDRRAA